MNNKVKKITHKWSIETKATRGYFIRHIDGDVQNNNVDNLSYIHPKQAFENPNWVVDWVIPLSAKEINFVKNNLDYFIQYYS